MSEQDSAGDRRGERVAGESGDEGPAERPADADTRGERDGGAASAVRDSAASDEAAPDADTETPAGYDRVTVLLPTLDEEETVGSVVRGFREAGFRTVLVVDGHSTDATREVARDAGARVVTQSGSGKGQAVREGVEVCDTEFVLLADGDRTYRPEDAAGMVEPLLSGDADHVIGDRFADLREGAMPRLNQVGNRVINRAFARIHGRDFGDILSGYRAFTRESFERMYLNADGFAIETEMAVEAAKHDLAVRVVPITYRPRPDGSETNLSPFRHGGIIVLSLYRLAKTSNPLFYFGSLGILSTLAGVAMAAYVGVEWVTRSVSHEVIAVVAAFAVLFGVQLLMFGVLSDLIVTLHHEQMHRRE